MFEIPKWQDFPVSYSFEAVVGLPVYKGLPSALQYSPSWKVGATNFTPSLSLLKAITVLWIEVGDCRMRHDTIG